jgi:Uma2 family endonuclease
MQWKKHRFSSLFSETRASLHSLTFSHPYGVRETELALPIPSPDAEVACILKVIGEDDDTGTVLSMIVEINSQTRSDSPRQANRLICERQL